MLTLWNPFIPTIRRSDYKDIFSMFDEMIQPSGIGINQVKNKDGSFTIDIDLPGMKESDINVNLSGDGIITVKGERKTKTSSYSFNKSFVLPEESNPESLSAELKDGVLTLNLEPKKLPEAKEPKKIPITAGK